MSFGGKSSSPAPTVQQTSTVSMSPEQRALYRAIQPNLMEYAQGDAQRYQGQTLAGFNQNEVNAQQGALQAADLGGLLGMQGAATNAFLMDPGLLSPDSNPYLKASADAITAQNTQNLLENVLPELRGGEFTTGGAYSSGGTRSGIAQGQAVGRTATANANAVSNLYRDAYQTGLATLGQAVTRNPQTMSSLLFAPETQAAVGSQQRSMEQAQLDQAQQQFYADQMLPYMRSFEILRAINAIPGGSATTTATGALPPSPSPLQAGLGGALAGASAGASFGPWGAGIGAIGGGLLSILGNR